MQRIALMTGTALILAACPVVTFAADDAGNPNLFSGSIYQSIAALLAFGIVVVVLGKFAWGPIIAGLQDRENKIKADLEKADEANRKAQQTLADYEQKLAEAHAEARKLVEQAKGDADKLRQKLAADAEADIAVLRDRAAKDIQQAKHAAVQDLYAAAGDLAVAVASKVLQRQINEADTQKLVEQSLKELDHLKVG